MPATEPPRRLLLVLGDQLDARSAAFDDFDPAHDRVWMAEVARESERTASSRPRIALFLAAMRHFAAELRERGIDVHYTRLDDEAAQAGLGEQLRADIERLRPRELVGVEPGEWGVRDELERAAAACSMRIEWRDDRHFYCSQAEFRQYARGRSSLRMEYFYRDMRRRHGVLMEGAQPVGGRWNFDADNREAFGPKGPGLVPAPLRFEPDACTREVLELVRRRFASHVGQLDDFDWPVTRAQALQALDDFVQHRLCGFGRWQDALWPGSPWLWHARLSAALNLKLLDPREVVDAAQQAWRDGRAELAAVEGFVRQVLGWREYVRGVYWLHMPGYVLRNELDARARLPELYWHGRTDMACLADAIGQTLRYGYAHHIQRLMITGLYGLLLGVDPARMHEWYLAVYVDAVEWVELPNTLGMSQYADSGVMASKPYVASGRYIERMSSGSLCAGCRYDPGQRSGERACPFTVLYWDFLLRHEQRLAANPRMLMQLRNLQRIDADERQRIVLAARRHREAVGALEPQAGTQEPSA